MDEHIRVDARAADSRVSCRVPQRDKKFLYRRNEPA